MIGSWWQLAAWTPRLLLAIGLLLAVLVVVVIAKHLTGIFRQ